MSVVSPDDVRLRSATDRPVDYECHTRNTAKNELYSVLVFAPRQEPRTHAGLNLEASSHPGCSAGQVSRLSQLADTLSAS